MKLSTKKFALIAGVGVVCMTVVMGLLSIVPKLVTEINGMQE